MKLIFKEILGLKFKSKTVFNHMFSHLFLHDKYLCVNKANQRAVKAVLHYCTTKG